MNGAEGAAEAVRARLEALVPERLMALEAAGGAIPSLPLEAAAGAGAPLQLSPRHYGAEDVGRLDLNQYPACLVVPQDEAGRRTGTDDDGATWWEVTYRLRAYGWVRAADTQGRRGYEVVQLGIRRLALAMREGLLIRPKLSDRHRLDPTRWRASFSEVGVDNRDKRSVQGVYLEVFVTAPEELSPPAVGNVATVDVTGQLLP